MEKQNNPWIFRSCVTLCVLMAIGCLTLGFSIYNTPFPADGFLHKWMVMDKELSIASERGQVRDLKAELVNKQAVVLSGKVRNQHQKKQIEHLMSQILSAYKLDYVIINHIEIYSSG